MIKTTYTATAHSCFGDFTFPSVTFPNADVPSMISLVREHKTVVLKAADGTYGITPYSAINFIEWTVVYGTEEAPHDDICDGYCANKGFGIVLKEVTSSCYTLDGGNLASMSFVVGGETITVPVLDGDVSGLIKSATYDCEAVNAEIAYEMAVSEGTATLTIAATYNGETVTKTISTETECA